MKGLGEVLHVHRTRAFNGAETLCACGPTWRSHFDHRAHLEAAVLDWLRERLAGAREDVAEVLYAEERDSLPEGGPQMPEWDDAVTDQRAWWLHHAEAALAAVAEALGVGEVRG